MVLVAKNLPADAESASDMGLIPGLGRCPEVGNDTPLQCCCLENSMGKGAQQATVHGATKIRLLTLCHLFSQASENVKLIL